MVARRHLDENGVNALCEMLVAVRSQPSDGGKEHPSGRLVTPSRDDPGFDPDELAPAGDGAVGPRNQMERLLVG